MNLKEKEVRNVRLFLTKAISKITAMLKKKNLSSELVSDLLKQQADLIRVREKLVSRFELKKLESFTSQWKKTISELTDDKVLSKLISGEGIEIATVEDIGSKNVKKRMQKKVISNG
jgi:cell division FtsZ-interacting protein ZapD